MIGSSVWPRYWETPWNYYGVGGWCMSCRLLTSCGNAVPLLFKYLAALFWTSRWHPVFWRIFPHQSICWAVDRGYSVCCIYMLTSTGTFPGDGSSETGYHMRIVYMKGVILDKVWKLVDLKCCKRKGTYMLDEALRVWPALQLLEPARDCALGPSLVGAQTIAFSFKYVQCVPSLTFWGME